MDLAGCAHCQGMHRYAHCQGMRGTIVVVHMVRLVCCWQCLAEPAAVHAAPAGRFFPSSNWGGPSYLWRPTLLSLRQCMCIAQGQKRSESTRSVRCSCCMAARWPVHHMACPRAALASGAYHVVHIMESVPLGACRGVHVAGEAALAMGPGCTPSSMLAMVAKHTAGRTSLRHE